MSLRPYSGKRAWLSALFFLSGAAALIYQLAWQRLLVFYTGSDTMSISLIVTAFMSGLGLGYLFGGRLADRSSPRTNLRYFIIAEAGIMLFALISKPLLYDGLYKVAPAVDSVALLYSLLFLVLVIPTFLMGVSLPLLSKVFEFGDIRTLARYIGQLYFVNTLGAAAGALFTGLFFVRLFGYEQTIHIGAVLNGVCAIGGLVLSRRYVIAGTSVTTSPGSSSKFVFSRGFFIWAGQFALSGFAALSLELIWFRVLGTLIKSIALTFSILLTVYLGCMAVGTYVGGRMSRSRSAEDLERLFLRSQYLLYLYTGAAFVVFIALLGRWAPLDLLWNYFFSYEPDLTAKVVVSTHLIVPLFLMGPPTFLMGFSFAVSQALVQERYEEVGRKVGWLQFSNIVGSTIGACWVSLLGFELFGTAVLLKLITCIGIVYAAALHWRKRHSTITTFFYSALLVSVVLFIPSNKAFWMRLNGMDDPTRIYQAENGSGLSIVKHRLRHGEWVGVVFANGLGQSWLPYRIDPTHTALGAVPVLLHPAPLKVGVVGMGSAGTLYGMAARSETVSMLCYEIMSNQPTVLRAYAEQVGDPAVLAVLDDPRLRIVGNDGRYELTVRNDRFDVIEADALRPNSAFSGNIYSAEYFNLIKERLNPGGWAVSWCPTPRTLSTFCSVFPYVAYSDGLLLIGSNEPIKLDWPALDERIQSAFTQRHFQRADIDIAAVVDPFREQLKVIDPRLHRAGEINTDLFPKDEFQLPYSEELIRQKLGLD